MADQPKGTCVRRGGTGEVGSLAAALARRSLKPQLNQIRTWVRQGRTDAWIAHQLGVTVKDIDAFKREHALVPDGGNGEPVLLGSPDDELDLRAEDDALVAAALEEEDDDEDEEPGAEASDGDGEGDERPKARRRRGRRGGRGRKRGKALEGTFDHGDEGYGLWLDPAIQDDPIYAEHWAGHRPVAVAVEPDRIVIRRLGEDSSSEDDGDED